MRHDFDKSYFFRSSTLHNSLSPKYDLSRLPRTRSGRIVIPRLDHWRFERVVRLKTGEIIISTNPFQLASDEDNVKMMLSSEDEEVKCTKHQRKVGTNATEDPILSTNNWKPNERTLERLSRPINGRHCKTTSKKMCAVGQSDQSSPDKGIKQNNNNKVNAYLHPIPICPLSVSMPPMETRTLDKKFFHKSLPLESSLGAKYNLRSKSDGKVADLILSKSSQSTQFEIAYNLALFRSQSVTDCAENCPPQFPICPLSKKIFFTDSTASGGRFSNKNLNKNSSELQNVRSKTGEDSTNKNCDKRNESKRVTAAIKNVSFLNIQVCLEDCRRPSSPHSLGGATRTLEKTEKGNSILNEKFPNNSSANASAGLMSATRNNIPCLRNRVCRATTHPLNKSPDGDVKCSNRASKCTNSQSVVSKPRRSRRKMQKVETEDKVPLNYRNVRTYSIKRKCDLQSTDEMVKDKEDAPKDEEGTSRELNVENLSCHLISPALTKSEMCSKPVLQPKNLSLEVFPGVCEPSHKSPKAVAVKPSTRKTCVVVDKLSNVQVTSASMADKDSKIRKVLPGAVFCNSNNMPKMASGKSVKRAKTVSRTSTHQQVEVAKRSKDASQDAEINKPKGKSENKAAFTARPGTLRFREQIRNYLISQSKEEDNDDFLDTTPFRKPSVIKGLGKLICRAQHDDSDDDLANVQTPKSVFPAVLPASTKRTPNMTAVISPTAFQPVNRKEIDRFLHHRKIAHKRKNKNCSPAVKKQKPTEVFSENVAETIKDLFTVALSDAEEDEECYYFFSDEET